MTVGTKSILFGVHQFLIHPLFVAAAWTKLYGWPWDARLWVAFFVHDLGYWGKPNMDGKEGQMHVFLGARIMHWLFDGRYHYDVEWYDFCLFHSRYYAAESGTLPSRLCFADKLATCLYPAWLYLPLAHLSGEIHEYISLARPGCRDGYMEVPSYDERRWLQGVQTYLRQWVGKHKDGSEDTWTRVDQSDRR